MAERSFAREVEKLRLGDGETFSGEGILAITKALLQCGVGYVGGYQGAPISHLMDVLADAQDILGELGVHFEASASEATATAMLAASVHYPIRGAATFKSTVGTNVASDALANLASGGVTGGALIIVGEDYGEGSSIMQERSHAFAMKSQVWLLDPAPEPAVDRRRCGAWLRTLGSVEHAGHAAGAHPLLPCAWLTSSTKDNKRPPMTVADALDNRRAATRSASCCRRPRSCTRRKRSPSAAGRNRLSSSAHGSTRPSAAMAGSASSARAACTMASSAPCSGSALPTLYGETEVPLHVLNVTYPLIEDESRRASATAKTRC